MLRHTKFTEKSLEKPQEKKVLASWYKISKKNVTSQPNKAQLQRSSAPFTKIKFRARTFEKLGNAHRNLAQTDVSSTESTNKSEKDKLGNVLALRKEINEWKRQEAFRSRVNDMLEKAGVIEDNNGIEENRSKFPETPKSFSDKFAVEYSTTTRETFLV